MASPLKLRRGRPPARRAASRRPKGVSAAHKYGPRRLGALYEISKLLTHFIETIEATVVTLLAIITKELPLQIVILIEKGGGRPKTIVWHAPDIGPADLRAAEARARKAFAALTRSAPPQAGPARGAAAGSAERGRFITCPLTVKGRPIFGALHLVGVSPLDEDDLKFVSAVADQLARALDLYHARLQEIARRRTAELSRQRAERELANRKQVEAEVRRLNAELERRVEERTSQFQDTIKALDAFTYSIAHDLRAPLRHVHGFSQILLRSANDDTCKDYAKRIMAASRGMDTLIKDLLAYSRLTLDQVEFQPLSLSSILAGIEASMAEELRQARARLVIEGPLPRVMGHEASLVQAITNLVSNAVKFAAPGVEPRVRVKAEVRDDRVRLWVEDNGIGIAPEHQERIFGVFQRLHRVEDYPGTGIGLAIVRRAVERMGGTAGVESEAGKGSRFWIELPGVAETR